MKRERFASLELGQKLRELRKQKGVNGPHLLSKLMSRKYSSAGILKRETGALRIDFDYLECFCDTLKLTQSEREDIMLQARVSFLRSQNDVVKMKGEYFDLRQRAKSVNYFSATMLPGLVQTYEYARAMIESYGNLKASDMYAKIRVENAQQTLENPSRQTQVVCTERALYNSVGSPEVMIAQLEKLLEFADEPYCEFRILPDVVFLNLPLHEDFEIIDGTHVICETRLGILTSEDKTTVARLREGFEQIWTKATMGLRRNKIVEKALEHYQKLKQ